MASRQTFALSDGQYGFVDSVFRRYILGVRRCDYGLHPTFLSIPLVSDVRI